MELTEYDCIYYNQSHDFFRPPLHNLGRTVKTDNHPMAVILKDNNMETKKQINLPEELKGKKFRIRKLTPRECFRLMGVNDIDIDFIQKSGLSNSAQYKLAGNSIVVDVLFHLFRKMFIETGPDKQEDTPQQLSLF